MLSCADSMSIIVNNLEIELLEIDFSELRIFSYLFLRGEGLVGEPFLCEGSSHLKKGALFSE